MTKNIAVVGCGHWGKNLVRNFAELGVLCSVSDPNVDLAQKYADQYGAKNESFSEVINDENIKGVVLAVPVPLHASLAIAALNAGKHVFVEKPLAMNQGEAELMIASSQKNNVHIMVGHLLQYHPVFVAARKMVESGGIGDLQYVYSNRLSYGKLRSEEDVIWSFAPHDISMILSLVGQEPILVKTESANIVQADVADVATLHLEFSSGLKAHISVSWLHPYKEQKLVVIGGTGMIVFDDTKSWEEKLALYRHTVNLTNNLPSLEKADVEYVSVPQSEPLKNECQYFVDLISDIITDIGTGGGMPGIIISIMIKNLKNSAKVDLYEKSHHKSSFLRNVSRDLKLNTEVIQKNIFDTQNLESGTIMARAFKPLPIILELVNKNFSNYKNLILFMGKNGEEILKESLKLWDFDFEKKQSITSKDSFLLNIKNIKKKPKN